MSVRLPLPDEQLRALFETFRVTVAETIWKARIGYCQNLVERASAWDEQGLRRRENQRELWESGAVGLIGRGQMVDTTAIYTDEEVLARLVTLQRTWPSEAEERARDVQRAYDDLLRVITPRLCPQKPTAKLHRVFATVLPWYFHRCFSRPSQKHATRLLLGESRYRPLQNAVLTRARLERVLGAQTLSEHVRHSFFCWWLHEQYERILAGEEIYTARQVDSHHAANLAAHAAVREPSSPGSEVRVERSREGALSLFLADIFDGDAAGLRRWVRLSLGKEIHDELPEGSANLSQLVFEATLAIQRHGRVDVALFVSLHELRPQWADRIWGVARLYGIERQMPEHADPSRSGNTASAPSTLTSANTRAATDPLDPLAMRLEDALKRKQKLEAAGLSTGAVLAEIRALKREHRRGGQLRPGDALGDRYLLAEQIGRGGFATVWRARDSANNEDVAIKVLHSELAGDAIRRQRFFRGARVMAELAHPVVVRIRECEAEDDGFFYFVMDFVPGGNLQDAVLAGRVNGEQAVPIILRIGEALAQAHARGHVHRDIKPVNILLTESGAPRLTDFDLVTGQDTTGGTRTGALGTFIYAAPEMMERPQDADARADVYGLGMSVAFVLHGDRLPRKALTARERFIDGLSCPPALKAVLMQATAENPDERYPDAAAFCEVLRVTTSPGRPLVENDLRADVMERTESGVTTIVMGESFVEPMTGMRFLWVPGGQFWMGSEVDEEDAFDTEKPRHLVEVSDYWLGETPVTNRQYEIFLREQRGSWEPKLWRDRKYNRPEQPVVGVSWLEAKEFCRWLSERSGQRIELPTEAQWERAARGDDGRSYPWGGEKPDETRARYGKTLDDDGLLPVGSLPAGRGPYGHLDLAGNVWEWCRDAWDGHAYEKRGELTVDPGPGEEDGGPGEARVCRGGAFISESRDLRSASRGSHAGVRVLSLGFRVAALPARR